MRSASTGFDHATMREAFGGVDRQWVSNGLVDAGTPGNNSPPVTFDADLGPLVNVTLQPSGLQVVCRVIGALAGNGEAEYWPFVEGDEVLVALPEGDERSNPFIIGRCNQALDKWPTTVGGQDATANNFAFTRTRTPYMFETASSWMVRSAGTGAFISMGSDGAITISDAQKAFISMSPDFIGLQDATGGLLLQLDLHDSNAVIQAGASRLLVDPAASSWLSSGGTIAIAGYGSSPLEHATSAEAVVNMLAQLLPLLGDAIATAFSAAPIPAPSPGGNLAPLIAPVFATVFGTVPAMIEAMLAAAGAGTIAPYTAAIAAALLLKPGSPTGNFPSVGAPGVMVG